MSGAQGSILGKWRRFRKLPPADRKLVLRAMAFLHMTETGLRVVGFRKWRQLIERFPAHAGRQALQPVAEATLVTRIVRATRSAELHGLKTPNCLERSLTLWWLLREKGIDAELHIGARKSESRFQAHAWVELAGAVLNDSADVHKHYTRFDAPIAAAEAHSDTAREAPSQ
jgi:Transglutaminase-like superfamily